MSEPAWVALGAPGGAIDYVGGWAAGTVYRAGDVVRHNGIEYLAVNPSTGQTPAPAAPLMTGTELAYAQITANVTLTSSNEAVPTDIVTAPPITVDGVTQILVEFFAPMGVTANAVNGLFAIGLWDGATYLGRLCQVTQPTTGNFNVPIRLAMKLTPTAGTHTYKVTGIQSSGNAVIWAGNASGGSTFVPAFIRISTVQPTAVAVRTFTAPGIGTTLPASPVDGDEYILVDSLTAPTYQWHFRYMAAKGSNKWVFIGGSAYTQWIATGETLATAAWSDLATVGPRFLVPVAGDYEAAGGTVGLHSVNSGTMQIGLAKGATTPLYSHTFLIANAGHRLSASLAARIDGVAAGSDVRLRYFTSGATCTYENRWIRVQPIAVGG